jgi:EAL domain-containing protein (putative c-di-GMP-specific phosphodiesterase class I)
MANSLGFDVIVEGVENEEQIAFLISKRCLNFQGNLFGKPVPIEQFDTVLEAA